MAGKTLHFEVEVVTVRSADDDEVAHGHVQGPGVPSTVKINSDDENNPSCLPDKSCCGG